VSKVQVHSIFANSDTNVPTIQASQNGIKKVFLNKENKITYPNNIAWPVVSNGTKFFAYPINDIEKQSPICRTSVDGINWVAESLTGSYPTKFDYPSTARWYLNTI
jgi:hypothetical protein